MLSPSSSRRLTMVMPLFYFQALTQRPTWSFWRAPTDQISWTLRWWGRGASTGRSLSVRWFSLDSGQFLWGGVQLFHYGFFFLKNNFSRTPGHKRKSLYFQSSPPTTETGQHPGKGEAGKKTRILDPGVFRWVSTTCCCVYRMWPFLSCSLSPFFQT